MVTAKILTAGLLLSGAISVQADDSEAPLVEGECPAISKDGRHLAFTRWEGLNNHLGVLDLENGEIEWIVRGESAATRNEKACHPAWGPDGELIFSYANITNTAYERFERHINERDGGYRLRMWKKGAGCSDFMMGLSRNYSPSFSPDGKTIYFIRQSKDGGVYFHGIAKTSALEPNDRWEEVRPYLTIDCGLSQPVVSPDGRYLAYAEMSRSGSQWGIKIADIDDTARQCSVTPGRISAYAPNWSPDSKYLVFTGFAMDDEGWSVYLQDISSWEVKRLCRGEDGCFSPDGRKIYYSLDGKIFARALTDDDFPRGIALKDPTLQPECVLGHDTATTGTVKRIGKEYAAKHPCDDQTVHFFRYKLDWDGRNGTVFPFAAGFHGAGDFWSFMIGGLLSTQSSGAVACDGRKVDVGTRVITQIIWHGCVFGSVDGSRPFPRRCNIPNGPCNGKAHAAFFPNGGLADARIKVYDLEYGVGWPTNVPAPLMIGQSRSSAEVRGALGPFVDRGEIAGVISVLSDRNYEETWDLFGYADAENKVPMKPDTLFAVFSMSKTFCGAAMMCAIDDGVLSLDDPVSKFLPEYADLRFADGRKPKREVTVRDVTSHTDGLRKELPILDITTSLREQARWYAAQPLVAEPGETFRYGTTRFGGAGAVIEIATGEEYYSYLKRRVLDPLGMKDTTFTPNDEQVARLVKAYTTKGGPFRPAADTCSHQLDFPKKGEIQPCPGGGLFSTAADMIRFSQMLAHHGEYRGKTIITRRTFDTVFSVLQVPAALNQPYTCGSWLYGDWFGHEGAMRTDQRANLVTGESRVFFIQTENKAGQAFFDAKIAWHKACDVYQHEEIPFHDELVKTHENDVDRTKAYQK